MLFSERSLWTMAHGIGLGGAGLLALSAVLFAFYLLGEREAIALSSDWPARAVAHLTGLAAVLLWLASLVGTYVVFPPYRATPPEGAADLAAYPRSLLLADPATSWLHAFAMETKEHLPWIATMLTTAVAFVAWRSGPRLLRDRSLRRTASGLLALSFLIVAYVSILGVFVNKVAPLE